VKKLIRKSFEFTSDEVFDILIEHLKNCGEIEEENKASYGIYNEEGEEIDFEKICIFTSGMVEV
jgi:hypothetical protein